MLPIPGLLVVAVITPGPNNIVVMSTALDRGFLRSLPVIAGIVFGTVALVGLVYFGLHPSSRSFPRFPRSYLLPEPGFGSISCPAKRKLRPCVEGRFRELGGLLY